MKEIKILKPKNFDEIDKTDVFMHIIENWNGIFHENVDYARAIGKPFLIVAKIGENIKKFTDWLDKGVIVYRVIWLDNVENIKTDVGIKLIKFEIGLLLHQSRREQI